MWRDVLHSTLRDELVASQHAFLGLLYLLFNLSRALLHLISCVERYLECFLPVLLLFLLPPLGLIRALSRHGILGMTDVFLGLIAGEFSRFNVEYLLSIYRHLVARDHALVQRVACVKAIVHFD